MLSYVDSLHNRDCVRWTGQFRDCTCSVMRRDIEDNCRNEYTYFEPVVFQDKRACPFVCENGGTYDERAHFCHCKDGYRGLCCESGELIY